MPDERRALVTLEATAWSGWDPDGYSIVTSAKLRVAKGSVLSPETLGHARAGFVGVEFLFYEVQVERVVVDQVQFLYKKLVIANPGGTINLTAPASGQFILKPRESMRLATPTMDGGTSVVVTLHEIQ